LESIPLRRRGKASRNGGASTPEQRDHFAKLARTWIKLAEELEQTAAFLAAIEDDEPTKKAG
jgi:hypothetical protein